MMNVCTTRDNVSLPKPLSHLIFFLVKDLILDNYSYLKLIYRNFNTNERRMATQMAQNYFS